jgi:DNA-3-methyladenine glycosylase
MKLSREFFNRHSPEVARDLLGQILVFGDYQGIITETESYRGLDDPASHSFRGPTPRSKIMFGIPGFSYVYFIYGMYHCLNIVTEEEGSPSAVLIRGIKLLNPPGCLLNGPGKICREMNITREHNGIDLITDKNFYVSEGEVVRDFTASPRVGITKATDKLWRFVSQKRH